MMPEATVTADYVIVGSGAGGGPLAIRLAEAGHSVVVIEAGGTGGGLVYDVPAFHAYATEATEMRWDFFVHHYDELAIEQQDPKYRPDKDGVLYPRASTVGGCTAHNALITVYPNDEDWDAIADLCGDDSWRAREMRRYFERLERCTYRWKEPKNGLAKWFARHTPLVRSLFAPSGHGFDGWLPTSVAKLTLLLEDTQLIEAVLSCVEQELGPTLYSSRRWWQPVRYILDPNASPVQDTSMEGVWLIPLAVGDVHRHGTREPLLSAAARPGTALRILSDCLATRLVLDGSGRCTGVEYKSGAHIYRADPGSGGATQPASGVAMAAREVILSAGAFNTPQLLMLSGIGPADRLRRHGIDVRVDLAGVGENLQDRYEISVVNRTKKNLALVTGGAFHPPRPGDPPDHYLEEWRRGKGPYATNGGLLAVIAKSSAAQPVPDLLLFALPADFRGYYPGYAENLELRPDHLTWVVLKAHTVNRAGTVQLRSTDPADPPDIRFHYFSEGSDAAQQDLDAVVSGVKLARRLSKALDGWDATEIFPGPEVDSDEEIGRYAASNAWGHHACGTCAIGPDGDPRAVLDSKFRVRGVPGLRVVDASVFPRIPGYFIVSAVYMASEKAADVILADAVGPDPGHLWPAPSPT
jgi:choline dehydrogenase